MKNTITISSDYVFACVDSVADDTNRIFVALNLGEATNPVLKIGLNGAEQSSQTLTAGKLNTVEIPGALFVSGGIVSFQYLDADYTGNVFTITFPAKLEGNLSVKMQSEYAFSAKYTVIGGGGGGGGSYTLPPATSDNLGGVIVGSGLTVEQSGKISVNVDAALSETSKNPVQNKLITARMNEVFQSVSDGKEKVAAAITDKGQPTAADATFQTMADNVLKIMPAGIITYSYSLIGKTGIAGTTTY